MIIERGPFLATVTVCHAIKHTIIQCTQSLQLLLDLEIRATDRLSLLAASRLIKLD